MQQGCRAYQHFILILQTEMTCQQVSQMVGSKAVLEASVIGSGINQVGEA
jgi:hypothetical protein